MSEQPATRETVFRVGVECGVSTAQGWWCMLSPAHSSACIPRRDTEYERRANEGPVRPGEEPVHFGDCHVNVAGHRLINGHCLYCGKTPEEMAGPGEEPTT